MDDNSVVKKFFEEMEKKLTLKLPKREDKVELTPQQKQMIKMWTAPFATTSAQCSACNMMYSSGYLVVCKADPTTFCSKKMDFEVFKPKGYTDEELGFYFGITRDELDE